MRIVVPEDDGPGQRRRVRRDCRDEGASGEIAGTTTTMTMTMTMMTMNRTGATTTTSVGYENKGSSMLEMPPPSDVASDSPSHQDVGEDVDAFDISTGGVQFVSMSKMQ